MAAHYGSPAGELSACVRAVGLGDRSDLRIFTLTGSPTAVREVIESATGTSLAVGDAVWFRSARWCGAGPGQAFVVVDPSASDRPFDAISLRVRLRADVTVTDVSEVWTAIAAVGARCHRLLERIGLDDPEVEAERSFRPALIAGSEAFVLRASAVEALILAPAWRATEVWRELEVAGQLLGLSIVGVEALERFALHERLSHQGPPRAASIMN